MPTILPLKKMTRLQKIRAMNELWGDLTSGNDDLPSPAWHGVELANRKAKSQAGEVVWTDWAVVKDRMRKKLHAH
ncbi:MAG: addiction module protein [Verrucomicrobiota bacterium]